MALYVITAIVATLTTFFAPAETAMIPLVVRREQLLTANGLFVLGLQASFALGFAVLGPLMVVLTGSTRRRYTVAGTYLVAGALCWTLPPAPSVLAGRAAPWQACRGARHLRPAARGPRLHPRPPQHLLAPRLPDHHLLAHRRAGGAGPELRQERWGSRPRTSGCPCCRWAWVWWAASSRSILFGKYVARKRLIETGQAILAASLLVSGGAQGLALPKGGLVTLLNVCVLVAFTAGCVRGRAGHALRPRSVRSSEDGSRAPACSTRSSAWPASRPSSSSARSPTSRGRRIAIMACAAVVGGTALASSFPGAGHGCLRPSHRQAPAHRPRHRRHPPTSFTAPAPLPARATSASVAHRLRACPGTLEPCVGRTACGAGFGIRPPAHRGRVHGGTISMLADPVTGAARLALDGAAILARTPCLGPIADVEPDWGLVSASHLALRASSTSPASCARRWRARRGRRGRGPHRHHRGDGYRVGRPRRLGQARGRRGRDAQRRRPGYEGPANLRDAVRAAAAAPGLGIRGRGGHGRRHPVGR
ncbi:MAG: hypothetical protein R3C32_10660 [Chloroflexota bacterium]